MEVNIKEELSKLDRNDFDQVCDLVDKIIEDICSTAKLENHPEWQEELRVAIMKDYMIDLINPNLLDFDKE
jgi:hypothetical protein